MLCGQGEGCEWVNTRKMRWVNTPVGHHQWSSVLPCSQIVFAPCQIEVHFVLLALTGEVLPGETATAHSEVSPQRACRSSRRFGAVPAIHGIKIEAFTRRAFDVDAEIIHRYRRKGVRVG